MGLTIGIYFIEIRPSQKLRNDYQDLFNVIQTDLSTKFAEYVSEKRQIEFNKAIQYFQDKETKEFLRSFEILREYSNQGLTIGEIEKLITLTEDLNHIEFKNKFLLLLSFQERSYLLEMFFLNISKASKTAGTDCSDSVYIYFARHEIHIDIIIDAILEGYSICPMLAVVSSCSTDTLLSILNDDKFVQKLNKKQLDELVKKFQGESTDLYYDFSALISFTDINLTINEFKSTKLYKLRKEEINL